jgi:hypothetical protein
MTYLQAIENEYCSNRGIVFDCAMFFVFIVEISNLMKTVDEAAEFACLDGERGCAWDGSGAHRIGL